MTMENYTFSYSDGNLHIKGYPKAVHLAEVTGQKSRLAASLLLHKNDLLHAQDCLKSITELMNETIKTALWRSAVVHYGKCFGSDIRNKLSPKKTLSGEPEGRPMHDYFIDLRNKHVVHDENDYHQCKVGAVINGPNEAEKVPKVICVSMQADTVDQQHCSQLYKLIQCAISYVDVAHENVCDSIIADLKKMDYKQLLNQKPMNIATPASEGVNTRREFE